MKTQTRTARTDNTSAQAFHNTAELLKKLSKDAHLDPRDRAMVSIYSQVIDRRTRNQR